MTLLLKSFILVLFIINSKNVFSQEQKGGFLTEKTYTDSSFKNIDNSIFKIYSTLKKNKLFIGYGLLPTQERIGVFYTGYIYNIFEKNSIEASFNYYSTGIYSFNAILYYHTYIETNRFDFYIGGGVQKLNNTQQFFRPIASFRGDATLTKSITLGIALIQPFVAETSYFYIPLVPFMILNLGYRF